MTRWAGLEDEVPEGEDAPAEQVPYDYTNMWELERYTLFKRLNETDENYTGEIIRILQAKFFDRWDRLNYTPPLRSAAVRVLAPR